MMKNIKYISYHKSWGLLVYKKALGCTLKLIKNEKIINVGKGAYQMGVSIGRFLWVSRAHNMIDPYSHIVVLTRLYLGYV